MQSMTSGEEISQKIEDKKKSFIESMAEDMVQKYSPLASCYIHKERFQGMFIEYMTKERQTVKICLPCIFKAIDKYLGV